MAETPDEAQLRQLAAKMREAEYKGLTEDEIKEREKQKNMRRSNNIQTLENTLDICLKRGGHIFTPEQMCIAQVLLPGDISRMRKEANGVSGASGCKFSCENADTLVVAQQKYNELIQKGAKADVLVLNMASATHAGGRTREGADAQEEELCRRTSLLLSLESCGAEAYYAYNNSNKTHMASDAVIFSPYVEVIKDSSGKILEQSFPISVISCAAPMVRLGLEGMSQSGYEDMFYKRIQGILLAAASHGYKHLVLGAFGCGIFGNDAALVSDLFYKAFSELPCAFDSVDFAVLCRPDKDYNYKQFSKNFS